MSDLNNSKFGGGGGDEEDEDEMEVDTSLLPIPGPDSDPLADPFRNEDERGDGDIESDVETKVVPSSSISAAVKQEPQEVPVLVEEEESIVPASVVFARKMEREVEEVISESINLIGIDPREYHPFYLKVADFIKLGQKSGHFGGGEDAALIIWKKFDAIARDKWQEYKNIEIKKEVTFTGQKSSFAIYILTRKYYVDGKRVKAPKWDRVRRENTFRKLEKTVKTISEEYYEAGPSQEEMENGLDLKLRLTFFKECSAMTRPGDCGRINTLWTELRNNFVNNRKSKLSTATNKTCVKKLNSSSSTSSVRLQPASDIPKGSTTRVKLLSYPVSKISSKSRTPPPNKEDLLNFQDLSVFTADMERNVGEVISEAINLLGKDPREYHPFYLTLFKFITVGQKNGHFPSGEDNGEILKVWKKFDTKAAKQWKDFKRKGEITSPYTGEMSPCASFILTKKMYLNGKLVTAQEKNTNEKKKRFQELEKIGKKILIKAKTTDDEGLGLRLKFFKECSTIIRPDDSVKMNSLWTKFCSGMLQVLKVKAKSPSPLNFPDSPCSDDQDSVIIPSTSSKKISTEPKKKIVKILVKTAKISKGSKVKKRKSSNNLKAVKKTKKKKRVKLKRIMTRKLICSSRKKLAGLHWEKIEIPSAAVLEGDEIPTPLLEKKIVELTRKIKFADYYCPSKKNRISSAPVSNTTCLKNVDTSLGPEFVTCDECGEVHRKEYLSIHKESAHDPTAIGRSCPLCPFENQHLWKNEKSLWCHCLATHVPDHLNPHKMSLTVESHIEVAKEASNQGEQMTKETVEAEKEGEEDEGNSEKSKSIRVATDPVVSSRKLAHFFCPLQGCNRKFSRRDTIRQHLIRNHEDIWTSRISKLVEVITGTGEQCKSSYQCKSCGWVGQSLRLLALHCFAGHPSTLEDEPEAIEADDEGQGLVKCPFCEENGRNKEGIRRHVEICHKENCWRCPEGDCGRVILSSEDLQNHFDKEHSYYKSGGNGDDGGGIREIRRNMMTRKRMLKQMARLVLKVRAKRALLERNRMKRKKMAAKNKKVARPKPKVASRKKTGGKNKTTTKRGRKQQPSKRLKSKKKTLRTRAPSTDNSEEEEEEVVVTTDRKRKSRASGGGSSTRHAYGTRRSVQDTRIKMDLGHLQKQQIRLLNMYDISLEIRKLFEKKVCHVPVERLS